MRRTEDALNVDTDLSELTNERRRKFSTKQRPSCTETVETFKQLESPSPRIESSWLFASSTRMLQYKHIPPACTLKVSTFNKLEINRLGRGALPYAGVLPRALNPRRASVSVAAMADESWRSHSFGTLLQPYLEDSLLNQFALPEGNGPIHYADFGCGNGAVTLGYAKFVVEMLRKRMIPDREVVCHFADLPLNDFNSLFNQITSEGDAEERKWFAAGVPGNQYGRMFPRSSLHVVISTLSLHFLSEIPKSVTDKASPAFNKGHIAVHGSEPVVAEAFAEALRKDMQKFFECRAEEMAPGGVLALYCTGRQERAHPENQYPDNTIIFMLHLEKAMKELVNEGVMAEEQLDTYNVNGCAPSVDEIREIAEQSGFEVQKLEYLPDFCPFPENAGDTMFKDVTSFATILTGMIKGAMFSKFAAHLGNELAEKLFERLRLNFEKMYAQSKAEGFFLPVPLCLAVLVRK